ncbi:MAG: S41 family peptidase [Chthoniobacteraceae bacterium]
MKKSAFLAAALALACAKAQDKSPDHVPAKSATEPATKTRPVVPADSADKKAEPAEAPPQQLSSHDAAEALSEDELRQIVEVLRGTYLNPDALSEMSLARAGIQGLLDRLGSGARIFSPGKKVEQRAEQFRSEMLNGMVGYLRLGALTPGNIAALDAALEGFAAKPPGAVVLDLRATPHSTDFELAAECCRRFSPKGRVLFSIKKPKANDEEILTSREDPRWRGLLTVLVDGGTAGAGEVIAAVLHTHLGAYVIGQQTKGEAAQFEEVPLAGGRVLRVAVGEVSLPDATPVFPGGLTPDLAVNVPPEKTEEVLQLAMNGTGVAPLVIEKSRARMNEAALVAGTNPELDEVQAVQKQREKGNVATKPPRDEVLQRALDYITSVRIFEAREAAGAGR